MTAPGTLITPWEAKGRRLAPLVGGVSAVVVAANDPSVAVSVAIGMARAHGERRVAIADLIGESPAIESQIGDEDPHGIADSFVYGVSLNRIARPMPGADNVFLLPSGTETVAQPEVYANDRWRRLAAGFHEVGALLIVVARPEVDGFTELCGHIGALMPVGDTPVAAPAGVRLITPPVPAPATPAPAPPDDSPAPFRRPSKARAREEAQHNEDSRARMRWIILMVVAAIVVAAGALWPRFADRLPAPLTAWLAQFAPAPDSTALIVPPTPMDTTPATERRRSDSASLGGAALADSTMRASAPPVTNPADSAAAARYAVYFANSNTRSGAMPDPKVRSLEAVALSPVLEDGEPWYRVTVGAAVSRSDAEAMLARLRSEKVIEAGAGSIVAVPFAFRLETKLTTALVPTRLAALAARGIFAYALRQPDGSATLYTGAFETPQQATALGDSLRTAGVAPVLVYRTGRGF